MRNSTEHKEHSCPVCQAIAKAKGAVLKTRKQDSAIPIILAAVGWEKSPKPWPSAVHALKEHAKSMVFTSALAEQLELVERRDAWLKEYERSMNAVSEPNSKARKDMARVLWQREQEFQGDLAKLERLKAEAGIDGTVSGFMNKLENKGLMDLLGISAHELTESIHASRKQSHALPDIRMQVTGGDIARQYNLSYNDRNLADLIAHLRNLMKPESFKVKRHSKPRKRQDADEGVLKERIALARPSIIRVYSTGQLVKIA